MVRLDEIKYDETMINQIYTAPTRARQEGTKRHAQAIFMQAACPMNDMNEVMNVTNDEGTNAIFLDGCDKCSVSYRNHTKY